MKHISVVGFYYALCLLLSLNSFQCLANSPQFTPVYFTHKTLHISLPLHQERMIKLPFEASLHLHPSIGNNLDVVIQGKVLLLKAKKKFIAGRAKIVSLSQQKEHPVLMISFTANSHTNSTKSLEIVVPSLVERDKSVQIKTTQEQKNSGGFDRHKEHPYKVLSRYAFQQAFSPERLIQPVVGLREISVFKGTLPLYEGGVFSTQVKGAYRLGNIYATIIEIANVTSVSQTLDPRNIRGKWLARSAYRYYLKAKGEPMSTTALVVLSQVPFEDAVGKYLTLGRVTHD